MKRAVLFVLAFILLCSPSHAYARGLPIIGLRTDFRQAGDTATSLANAMIECICVHIYRSADDLLTALTG